jgi:hydroxymethylbilane synthase
METILLATRPSKLAVTQSGQVAEMLRQACPGYRFKLVEISTRGDRDSSSSLVSFGGTGLFVKELEEAMLAGKAHAAVHSLKDVPSALPAGMQLVCFPKRENPADVFISASGAGLADMPLGFTVGTGSPRRALQLLAARPDAVCKEIRGNIDTRLRKLHEGLYDSIMLAQAGLSRLGIEPAAQALDPQLFLPAPGQGCLVIECPANSPYKDILRSISCKQAEICASAEREFMAAAEGGCKFPMAAYAYSSPAAYTLKAMLGGGKTMAHLVQSIDFAAGDKENIRSFALKMKEQCRAQGIELSSF